MTDEGLPIALVNTEPAMGDLHVTPDVVKRATRRRAQEIDQQLLLAAHAILATVLPKPRELPICSQPGEKIIGDGCNRIISTQPRIKCFRHIPLPDLKPSRWSCEPKTEWPPPRFEIVRPRPRARYA